MKIFVFTLVASFLCSLGYAQSSPKMITIKGGSFDMGSENGQPNERPVHKVTLSSFRLARNEVTLREFATFIAITNYQTDADKKGFSLVFQNDSIEWHWKKDVNWRDDEVGNPRPESDWNMPVIYVSWNDAQAYCQWLSSETGRHFRLPTEAEWEYAAGNGARHTRFGWGNDLPVNGHAAGNLRDESTHPIYGAWPQPKFTGYYDGYYFCSPVQTYEPNDFGLYDMTGNVWEWCSDGYDIYDGKPTTDPQGPESGWTRVFRGGSWHSNPSHSRVTFRYSGSPENHTPNLGFRLAESIPSKK